MTTTRRTNTANPSDPTNDQGDSPTAEPLGELAWLDPRTLTPHPANLRQDLGDLSELTASIASTGILEPLIVIPDGDTTWIAAGHRRAPAAIAAGVALIPCILRPDLAQDTDVLLVMLAENIRRQSLTLAEETHGYHQLAIAGLSANRIAKATGTRVGRVRKTLTVARSELAATVTGRYDLTLDQALAVAEFDADREAVKLLVACATKHPQRWDHLLSQLRTERDDQQARQATIDRLTEAGITIIDTDQLPHTATPLHRLADPDGNPLDPDYHTTCPGHAITLHPWDPTGTVPYCLDPDANGHNPPPRSGHPTTGDPTETPAHGLSDEQKTERREVVANNRAWRAAQPVRRQFVRSLLARRTAPKTALRYAVEAVLARPGTLGTADETLLADLTGRQAPDPLPYGQHPVGLALANETPDPRLALALLARVAADHEDALTTRTWRNPTPHTAGWLTWLATVGYTPSDIETTVIAAFSENPAEPAA